MAKEIKLHLDEVQTKNGIDSVEENVWSLVTEDMHLLLEIDLKRHMGFTKSQNHRFAQVINQKIKIRRPDKPPETLKQMLSLTVFQKRLCLYCGQKIEKPEDCTHPKEVHNQCWPLYVKQNPEAEEA